MLPFVIPHNAQGKFARANEAVRILKFIAYKFQWSKVDSYLLEQLVVAYANRSSQPVMVTRDAIWGALDQLVEFPNTEMMHRLLSTESQKARAKIQRDVAHFRANEHQVLHSWLMLPQ